MSEKARQDGIESMEDSIDTLNHTYNRLEKEYRKPGRPLGQKRQILQELGGVHVEILSQELFLLHLRRSTTTVQPPTAHSGEQLVEALETLDKLLQSNHALTGLLSLAAAVVTNTAGHRREVDDRTSE